ncbi:MAG: FliH/SctL family protein [bacterium]|nr:FliH/SctL family protein [bacterium]
MEYTIKTDMPLKNISFNGSRPNASKNLDFWNKVYEEGFKDGIIKGTEKGLTMAKNELQNTKEKLEFLVHSFLEEKEKLLKSSEITVFKLVKEIAKKVIEIEISENSKVIVDTVSDAIKRIREEERVIIKVNPVDFDIIKSKESEWLASLPYVSKFQIIADENISRGGCLIETSVGKIDATIESKLKKLEEL